MGYRTNFWSVDLKKLDELIGSRNADVANKLQKKLEPWLVELDQELDESLNDDPLTAAAALQNLVMGAELEDDPLYGHVLELLCSDLGQPIIVYSDGLVIVGDDPPPPKRGRFNVEISWLFELDFDTPLNGERGPWFPLPEIDMLMIEYLTRNELPGEVAKVKAAIENGDYDELYDGAFLRYLEAARDAQLDLVTFTY